MYSLIQSTRTGRLLMGGIQDKLIEFDIGTQKEVKVHALDSPEASCAILREHGRFICCGDANRGKVVLRDPASMKVVHSLDAHTGILSDFDVQGHHLVTCGQTMRHGLAQPDRFLMMYDLRILKAISPIQVVVPPFQLRFLPALSSRIAVLSPIGQVQLVDTTAFSTPNLAVFNVNVPYEECSVLSMDISPSNQFMSFGDLSNTVHLYSSVSVSVTESRFNPYARETEFADPPTTYPSMKIDDPFAIFSSVPRPHLPPTQAKYASDFWPERFNREAFRPVPEIDPEILRTMKVVGAIGYARNMTNMQRNQVRYPNIKKNDQRERDGKEGGGGHVAVHACIPKHYRKVIVKLSKMGTDDFDFDRYNRTGFCGLEASLPNSYCNAMLQILYFTEKLRILMLNHTCNRENCVCCELSFLFHMMDISPGMPCHSGNFLRGLRTIPEASALGLVFPDQASVWSANVPRLVQSWNRFILHQISVQLANSKVSNDSQPGSKIKQTPSEPPSEKDLKDSAVFSELFGMKQDKVNICTKCNAKSSTQDTLLLCNLVYPDSKEPTNFESIVGESMGQEQTTPAWCEKCRKYQSTNKRRNLLSLPHVLSLNAGLDNAQDKAYWQAQMEALYEKNKPAAETVSAPSKPIVPPPNAKPCRYGLSCNRPDCKFWHPEPEVGAKETEDVGDKLAKLNLSWIPEQMTLKRHANGHISSTDEDKCDEEVVESRTYQL